MTRGQATDDARFVWDEGLPHPVWGEFLARMDREHNDEQLREAWSAAEDVWLTVLANALGTGHRITESACGEFALLSALSPKDVSVLIATATSTLRFLREHLGAIETPQEKNSQDAGSFVLIAPATTDSYYSYLSHFYPDGEHAQSGGVFLAHGYAHIVIAPGELDDQASTVAHELSHHFVSHLQLPNWVDEGLACTVQNTVMGVGAPELSKERIEETREHWEQMGTETYWSGEAYNSVASSAFAYLTAEIMVRRMLFRFRDRFAGFLRDAGWDSQADVAARRHFGLRTQSLAPDLLPRSSA